MVTGDSLEEVLIFRDRHTCIIIYISSFDVKVSQDKDGGQLHKMLMDKAGHTIVE